VRQNDIDGGKEAQLSASAAADRGWDESLYEGDPRFA